MTFKMPIRGEPFVRNLQGQIQSVLVATWPDDEVELWRTGLWNPESPDLRVFRIVTGYPYDATSVLSGNAMFVYPIDLPRTDWLPYLRWAASELGLVRRGQTPFPKDGPGIGDWNPWIGAFTGRTMVDVERSARWFDDHILDQNFATEPYMALFVPFVNDERGNADLFERHYPTGWRDRPILGRGTLMFDLDREEGDTMEEASKKSYILDVSRVLVEHSSTNVGRIRTRSLVEALPNLASLSVHPTWAILPKDDAERWWDDHTKVGQLALPEEEQQIYRLIGDPMPFAWPPEKLKAWAEARWTEGGLSSPSHIPVPHRRHR